MVAEAAGAAAVVHELAAAHAPVVVCPGVAADTVAVAGDIAEAPAALLRCRGHQVGHRRSTGQVVAMQVLGRVTAIYRRPVVDLAEVLVVVRAAATSLVGRVAHGQARAVAPELAVVLVQVRRASADVHHSVICRTSWIFPQAVMPVAIDHQLGPAEVERWLAAPWQEVPQQSS